MEDPIHIQRITPDDRRKLTILQAKKYNTSNQCLLAIPRIRTVPYSSHHQSHQTQVHHFPIKHTKLNGIIHTTIRAASNNSGLIKNPQNEQYKDSRPGLSGLRISTPYIEPVGSNKKYNSIRLMKNKIEPCNSKANSSHHKSIGKEQHIQSISGKNDTDISAFKSKNVKKVKPFGAYNRRCCFLCVFLTVIAAMAVVAVVVIPLVIGSTMSKTTTSSADTNTRTTTTTTSISPTTTNTRTTTTSTKTTITTSTSGIPTTTNICRGSYTYVTQLLFLNVTSALAWTQYKFNYTTPSVTSARLTFSFRNDPNYWYLDDVSVTNSSGQQLLLNNGFEQGTLANWIYCNPNNASSAGAVTNSDKYSGSYSYRDGAVGTPDYLSQTFNVLPSNVYTVSFWLKAPSSTATFAWITISA